MNTFISLKRGSGNRDLVRVWVCFFVMPINIYSEFLENITGIDTLIFNIGSFVILLFLAMPKLMYKHRIDKRIGLITGTVFALVVIHISLYGNYINEIKQVSYILEFLIVATLYNDKYFANAKKVIIIISIIMSFDAIANLPKLISSNYNLFNVRQYTMLDKPYYTLIFSLAIVFLVSMLIERKAKYKGIIVSLIILLCAVLFGIIGSKTALVAVVVGTIVMLLKNKKKRKSLYLGFIVIGIAAFIYLAILHKKLPNFLMSIIYFLKGQYAVIPYAYAQSYFIRFEIVELALITFLAHPLFGCGFNNYYNYVSMRRLQHYSIGITDVESDVLAIISEGGIVYAMIILSLFYHIFIKLMAKRQLLKEKGYHFLDAFGCMICMMILIIGNDFMSSFYWCLLGMVYGCATKKNNMNRTSFSEV